METRKKTVLVVDEADSVVRLLEIVLSRLNYQTLRATTSTEALGMARLTSPDLVISETRLRDGSGFDLLNSLREGEATASIPVVFLSALDSPELRSRAREMGAQAFLTKPLNVRALYMAIEDHLEQRRRKYIRLPLTLVVRVKAGDEVIALQTQSFGERGLFLKTHTPQPLGSRLELTVQLPGVGQPLAVEAEVVHSILPPVRTGYPGMGVRFLEIPPEVGRTFSDFMEASLTGSSLEPAPREVMTPALAC